MDPEREEELREIRERRREQERRRKIKEHAVITIVLLAVIAAGAVIYSGYHRTASIAKSASPSASEGVADASSQQAEPAEEQQAEQDAASSASQEAQAEQNTASLNQEQLSLAGDRSVFAVDPANVPSDFDDNGEKTIYLTFDDGPSENTRKVLDILDQYNAKATFFVTGLHQEYKDMIKEAYDRGHTIGLHTYSHNYAAVYQSEDAYFSDLDQIGQLVESEIGYVPCFIRFPGGSSNTVSKKYTAGIMTQLSKDVTAKGYQYYDWNVSFGDGTTRTAEDIVSIATGGTQTNIVMLAHDASGKDTTVEALPTVLQYYTDQGYVFKSIDRDSIVVHHGINN